MFVSFVIYTRQWIIAVIILTLIFSIGIPLNKKEDSNLGKSEAYTIQIENIEKTYDKSAIKWYNILAELQEANCKKIVILYGESDIEEIKEKLAPYSKQEITWVVDEELNKNQIKIILER